MSRIFGIVFDAIFSIIGIVFIGWLFWRALKRSDDPARLIFKWTITLVLFGVMFFVAMPMFAQGGFAAIVGLFVAGIWGIAMTITWRHSLIDLIANPIASIYDGGKEPPEPKPFYSVVLAKRKRGQFLEAAMETRKQLDRFPNDYEGVMLLAAIQAENLKDLAAAENTLTIFCNAEGSPPLQVCAALTQLADWHLKLAQDTDSARVFLEKIVALYPNTLQAAQAAERIAHLGGTRETMEAARERQPTVVPEGIQSAGLRETMQDLIPEESDPKKLAADFVKHLEQHPDDAEAREKLAVIYANHYKRLDLAALELNQLIEQPEQPPKRVAHWLNLLADLQVRGGTDYETARVTLEKIVARFPDLPVAELARNRLGRLKLEFKGRQEQSSVKLGVYEQNIGLKYGSPRQL